jgi:hypothetical protein
MDGKFKFADIIVVLLCMSGAALSVNLFRLDLFKMLDHRDEKPIGTVVIKHNIVQRRVADRVLWDRPAIESPVYNGDLIRTDEFSDATLYIDNNSIDLDENTIIRIQRSAGGGDHIQIELNGGTLYVATGSGGGNLVLNMAGFQVETRPDTVLNAEAGSGGIVLKVSEGSVLFANEDWKRELTSGTMIALDDTGTEITNPAVIITQFRLNAYFLKSGPEPLRINFRWDRINLEAGELLRLEIASDKNFGRIARVIENLDTSASAALGVGLWYWRIIRKDEVLHKGHFTVTDAAGPQLLSPAVDALFRYQDNLPRTRFQWAETVEASSYILEASETEDFRNLRLRKETSSAFLVDSSLGQGTWYWRVMPVFPSVYEGSAAFSPASFFRIEHNDNIVQEPEAVTGRSGPQLPVQVVEAQRPNFSTQQQILPSPQVNQQQVPPSPQVVQQQLSPSPQVVQQQTTVNQYVEQQPTTVNPAANIQNFAVSDPHIPRPSLAARLAWLLANAREGDEHVMEVTSNESISPQDLSYSGKKVRITIKGDTAGRNIELNTNGSMFRIHNGTTLILENITLRGRNSNNVPLVNVVNGGTLIMNSGATITGNINNDRRNEGGGGVMVSGGGTFTMNNGSINANSAIARGGGVKVSEDGTFTMSGGTISGNTSANESGGGVDMHRGTFTMSGGTISGNTSMGGGGGVVAWEGAFTMEGGTISGNTSDWGGGVQVGGQHGTFTMRGGTISGNTAKDGGGVNVIEAGTFTMRGGTISGNTSVNEFGGGGVHVWKGYFSKTGGIIYGYSVRDSNSNRATNGNAHAIMVGRDNYYRYRSATATDMGISFDYTKNQPTGGRGWLE